MSELPLKDALAELHDRDLETVILALATSATQIASLCRIGLHTPTESASQNAFGDSQLQIDVKADAIIQQSLQSTGLVAVSSSEEQPVETPITSGARFAVAYDPLDGSSIIACNWAVGTIAAIWEGGHLIGTTGRNIAASMAVVYGPRTTMFIAAAACDGVRECILRKDTWYVTRVIDNLGERRVFAPANLRCARPGSRYARLVEWYMHEGYTLRYSGGMVPDVTQILVRNGGIFTSPISEDAPAKLRLLYEALPMAHLMEKAGGASTDGKGSLLRCVITHCELRTPLCLGSREEVNRFERVCGRGIAPAT